MQVHAGHTLRCFLGVVVVVDIDHQAAQQLAHLAGDLDFQLIEFTVLQVLGDVVVRQEGDASRLEAFADAPAHGGQLTGNTRGQG